MMLLTTAVAGGSGAPGAASAAGEAGEPASILPRTGMKLLIPVIPTAFADVPLGIGDDALRARLDSIETYYNAQLGGAELEFCICDKVTLRQSRGYYGADSPEYLDAMLYKAVIEAATEIDDQTAFDSFDNSSSGSVDCIMMFFAGCSQERSGVQECIWPQFSKLEYFKASLALDGRLINQFCAFSEDDLFGTICHELGHSLGLVDLYDTDGDGSGGLSGGVGGCNALMDRGRHNDEGRTPPALCSPELDLLECGRGMELTEGEHSLEPLSRGGGYFTISSGNGESFLIENRFREGWDSFIDGDGLLVYHIDKRNSPAGWSDFFQRELSAAERWRLNQVNCRPDRMLAAPLLPSGYGKKYFRSGIGLDEGSRLTFYDGTLCPLVIDNLRFDPDGKASFVVYEGIEIEETAVFQDAVILSWETAEQFGQDLSYKLYVNGPTGPVRVTGSKVPHATVDELEPGVEYELELIAVRPDGGSVACRKAFKTKTRPEGIPAYIYLASAEKNVDGSFRSGSRIPLRIVNLEAPAKVEWFFDGKPVNPSEDGWYTLSVSGELKAVVSLSDGSKETIIRNLRVR